MSSHATLAGPSRLQPPLLHLSSAGNESDGDVIEISPREYAVSGSRNNNNLRNELHTARNLNAHKDAMIALKDAEIQRLMERNSEFEKQNRGNRHNHSESSSTDQQLKEALLALKQKDELLEAQKERLQAAILKTSQTEMLTAENEFPKKKLQKSEEARSYFEDRANKWENSYQIDTQALQKLNTTLLETQKQHQTEKIEWEEKFKSMVKDNEKLQRKVDRYKKESKKRSRKERRRSDDVSLEDVEIDNEVLVAENDELKIDICLLESQKITLQQEKMELKTENTRLQVENVLLKTQNPLLQEENTYIKIANNTLMEDLREKEEKYKILMREQEEKDSRKSSADKYRRQSTSKRNYEHHDRSRDRHRNDDSERYRNYRHSEDTSFFGAHWESYRKRGRTDYQCY